MKLYNSEIHADSKLIVLSDGSLHSLGPQKHLEAVIFQKKWRYREQVHQTSLVICMDVHMNSISVAAN